MALMLRLPNPGEGQSCAQDLGQVTCQGVIKRVHETAAAQRDIMPPQTEPIQMFRVQPWAELLGQYIKRSPALHI